MVAAAAGIVVIVSVALPAASAVIAEIDVAAVGCHMLS